MRCVFFENPCFRFHLFIHSFFEYVLICDYVIRVTLSIFCDSKVLLKSSRLFIEDKPEKREADDTISAILRVN